MNVVVPMAGRGQRFVDAGYRVPKPLIDIAGRPMYAWAVDSLPLELATRLVFVCLASHLRRRPLEADIRSRYEERAPMVLGLEGVTDGQVCTVLAARSVIDEDQPLLIYNADTVCRTSLGSTLPSLPSGVDGVMGVFEAPGTHWSFARTDGTGRVLETAEKRRISPWATTGLYYFTRGRDFVRHADDMVAAGHRTKGEFYVAPLYNRMIRDGADIRVDVAHAVWPLGTPEDMERFEREHDAHEG